MHHTFNTHNIRTLVIDGTLFFCALDLKTPLNIVNKTIQSLDQRYLIARPVKGRHKGKVIMINATFISLDGVYQLCNRTFKKWIKSEVVPSEMM